MTDPVFPTDERAIDQLSDIEDPESTDGDQEELEEELIIEDFTIDGICGVY